MADDKEVKRIKRLLGDRYEPRLRQAVLLLASVNCLRPTGTSESIRVARLKLVLLDRLGLSRAGVPEPEEDPDDSGQIRGDDFESF